MRTDLVCICLAVLTGSVSYAGAENPEGVKIPEIADSSRVIGTNCAATASGGVLSTQTNCMPPEQPRGGIIPAKINPSWGQFKSYYPEVTARFLGTSDGGASNAAQYQVITVAARPDASASFDVIEYSDPSHINGRECFDLKWVALRRLSDGAMQGVNMWVLAGTKSLDGTTFYPLRIERLGTGLDQAYVYFDPNDNHIPYNIPDDSAANTFRVSVPGDGIPYAFHDTYDKRYLINVWYDQTGAERMQPITRQFWAAVYFTPEDHTNPYWPDGQYGIRSTQLCLRKAEAWWYRNYGDTAGRGTWGYGAGDVSQRNGEYWPNSYYYGSTDYHAKDVSAMWHVNFWYPHQWNYGPNNIWNSHLTQGPDPNVEKTRPFPRPGNGQ